MKHSEILGLRIDSELLDQVRTISTTHDRSISQEIAHLIKIGLRFYQKINPKKGK